MTNTLESKTLSRRSFLSGMGALAGLGASATLANTTETLSISKMTCYSPKLPRQFSGYTICFLTDIHYGEALSRSFIEDLLFQIKHYNIDLLALGGDYLWIPHSLKARSARYVRNQRFADLHYAKLPQTILDELFSLITESIRPRDGIYAVLGNHDHWHNGRICLEVMEKYDVHPLINSATTIRRNTASINLLGVDDYLTGFPKLPSKLNEESKFSILINHNPDYVIDWLEYTGRLPADLILNGHTHGGQMRVPLLGTSLLCNVADPEFVYGTVLRDQRMSFTSRGIGVVELPYRVACPPEICIIRLEHSETAGMSI